MENPLKIKRQNLGLSKKEIANRLNIKLTNIKDWEYSRRNPKSNYILKLANAYEMTEEEILKYLKYLEIIRNDDKQRGI